MIVRKGPESVYGADIPLSVVGISMKGFGTVIAFSVGIAVGGNRSLGTIMGRSILSGCFRCIAWWL